MNVTSDQRVAAIRRFNRFYTSHIGTLQERWLQSDLTLTEARIVYELATRAGETTAALLCSELAVDPSYLSRILRRLEGDGLLVRTPHLSDARQVVLTLTEQGQRLFRTLDARADRHIMDLLEPLEPEERSKLSEAMRTIEDLLVDRGRESAAADGVILRADRPGDMGWIIYRHGGMIAQEMGWGDDNRFEALVAEICVKFMRENDPSCERCWIAEYAGEIVGSVFIVRESEDTAKLRLLYVEPSARGLGIGTRLVATTLEYARQVGYRRMVLWTMSCLHSARRIYEAHGFTLQHEEPNTEFGEGLTAQVWARDL